MIHFFFDPPHLLKNIRTNLKNHGYESVEGDVLWKYIVDFYNFDTENGLRLAPKLSSKHFDLPAFSKLNVSLAAQILSYSVAAGIDFFSEISHDDSPKATSTFIRNMDTLFDLFNGRTMHSTKPLRRPMSKESDHKEVLKNLLDWLNTISVNSQSGDRLPCLRGWKMSVKSLLGLFEDLSSNYGVKYLFANRLNQDCVENLFSQIRGNNGGVTRPNPAQFKCFFKKAMVQSIYSHPNGANCQEDDAHYFLGLRDLIQPQYTTTNLKPETEQVADNLLTQLLSHTNESEQIADSPLFQETISVDSSIDESEKVADCLVTRETVSVDSCTDRSEQVADSLLTQQTVSLDSCEDDQFIIMVSDGCQSQSFAISHSDGSHEVREDHTYCNAPENIHRVSHGVPSACRNVDHFPSNQNDINRASRTESISALANSKVMRSGRHLRAVGTYISGYIAKGLFKKKRSLALSANMRQLVSGVIVTTSDF